MNYITGHIMETEDYEIHNNKFIFRPEFNASIYIYIKQI